MQKVGQLEHTWAGYGADQVRCQGLRTAIWMVGQTDRMRWESEWSPMLDETQLPGILQHYGEQASRDMTLAQ